MMDDLSRATGLSRSQRRRRDSSASASDSLERDAGSTSIASGSTRAKSCRECIRLKLKCSRSPWPCDKCMQRGTADICPDGQLPTRPYRRARRSSIQSEQNISSKAVPAQRVYRDSMPVAQERRTHSADQDSFLPPAEQSSDEVIPDHDPQIQQHPSTSEVSPRGARRQYLSERESLAPSLAMMNEHGSLQLGSEGTTTSYIGPGGHSFSLAHINEGNEDYTRPASPVHWGLDNPVPTQLAAPRDAQSLSAMRADDHAFARTDSTGFTTLLQADALSLLVTQPAALVPTPGVRAPFPLRTLAAEMRKNLPSPERARRAFQVYFWNVSWMYDPIHQIGRLWKTFYPHDALDTEIEQDTNENGDQQEPLHISASASVDLHRLALIFSVLSLGILFDVDKSNDQDGVSAEHCYQCSWAALSLSNINNTSSIESVQTIHLLGQYLCNRKSGRNADSFYPLIGYAVRSAIAMGLHRDAKAWSLTMTDLEERRRVFWELFACDSFRSLAYGRPCNVEDRHTNAPLPQPRTKMRSSDLFHTSKFRLVRLLNRIIDCTYGQADIEYTRILKLDSELRELASHVPAEIGTQIWSTRRELSSDDAAMRLDNVEQLCEMHTQLQAHTIAVNVHQVFLHLHRPWFMKAIRSSDEDDIFTSPYIRSVIAVSESSRTLISIGVSIAQKARAVSLQWNFFWQHVFNAAICQCLYLLYSPHAMTAASAWDDIDRALALLKQVRSDPTDTIWTSKLELLERMKSQVGMRLNDRKRPKSSHADNNSQQDSLSLIGATTTIDRRTERRSRNDEAGTDAPRGQKGTLRTEAAPSSMQHGMAGDGHVATTSAHAGQIPVQPQHGDVNSSAWPDAHNAGLMEMDAFSSLLQHASHDGGVNLADLLLDGSEHDIRFWEQFSMGLPQNSSMNAQQ